VILKGTTDIAFLSWMVVSVAAYWATPARLRTEAVILTTAIFLALADPISLGIFATMTAVVFVACRSGSATIIGAIVIIIATLFAFKAIDPNRGVFGDGNHIIPLGLSLLAGNPTAEPAPTRGIFVLLANDHRRPGPPLPGLHI
jgi:hypothetical protein